MMEKIFSPETYSMLGQWALGFCKSLLVAIIVYIIGSWLIKWIKKLFVKMLESSKVDSTLYSFLTSIVSVGATVSMRCPAMTTCVVPPSSRSCSMMFCSVWLFSLLLRVSMRWRCSTSRLFHW